MIAGILGRSRCLAEHALGVSELADVHQRLTEVRQQLEPFGVEHGEQRGRSPHQVRGGRHVAAGERPAARGPQPFGRSSPDGSAAIVERPELGEIPVRLLEVVAEDLLVLAAAVAVHGLGPLREPLVELGAVPLQEPGIRRVPDQDVLEGVRRAGGHDRGVRLDEPAP